MGKPFDPARATRERLLQLESRQKARVEARAVAEGVDESVRLARRRGAAFAKDGAVRAARETPYQRLTGLEWLLRKARIGPDQAAAGQRYGEAFRRAGAAPSLPSTLEIPLGGGAGNGPSLTMILKQGAGRAQAEALLARYRRQLLGQADLIAACDLVCGRELTPREAAGGERDAARMEAVLKVALDILAAASR